MVTRQCWTSITFLTSFIFNKTLLSLLVQNQETTFCSPKFPKAKMSRVQNCWVRTRSYRSGTSLQYVFSILWLRLGFRQVVDTTDTRLPLWF